MDFEQMRSLNRSGRFSSSVPLSFPHTSEFEPHPHPEDNIAHVECPHPLTANDCNGMSIADVHALHSLRNSDPLHKVDAVANMALRGAALKEQLKTDGTANFPGNYKS